MRRPAKIISGAQTGADLGALRAAQTLGIATGGWCPAGCRTETGPRPWLIARYELTETPGCTAYLPRTRLNIRDSDGTVIYGDLRAPGSQQTYQLVYGRKPWVINPSPAQLRAWVRQHQIAVLNVAGNRESGNPGIEAYVYAQLLATWGGATMQPAGDVYTPRLYPAQSEGVSVAALT